MSLESHNAFAKALGGAISQHQARRGLRIFYAVLASVGLAGGVLCAAYGIWRWIFGYQHYGPAVVWRLSSGHFAAAIGLILLGASALAMVIELRGLIIKTYAKGLTFGRGARRRAVLWQQIRKVNTLAVLYNHSGLSFGGHATIVLTLDDGHPLRLSNALEQIETLAAVVKRNVYPLLLAECKEKLRQRQTLPFGPLELSLQGIQHGDRLLVWENVGSVAIARGQLLISGINAQSGPNIRVPVRKVPNIEICAHLIRQLGPGQ
jgi:hypothetical protein